VPIRHTVHEQVEPPGVEVVSQPGTPDRYLALVGRTESWLYEDTGREAQHVVEVCLTSAPQLAGPDDRHSPWNLGRPLPRLIEGRSRAADGHVAQRRRAPA